MASSEIPKRRILQDHLDAAAHHKYVPSLDDEEVKKRQALRDKGYTNASEQAAGAATAEKVLLDLYPTEPDGDIEPARQWSMVAGAAMLNAGLYGMRLIGDPHRSYYVRLPFTWKPTPETSTQYISPTKFRAEVRNDLFAARMSTENLRKTIEEGKDVSNTKIENLSRHLLSTALSVSAYTVEYNERDSDATRQKRIRDLNDEMVETGIDLIDKVVGVDGPMNVSLAGLSSTRSELGQHILNDRSYRPELKFAFQNGTTR